MTRSNEPAGTRQKASRIILGCSFGAAMAVAMTAQAADTTFDRLLNAGSEPQNWLTHHGSLNAQRHSQLDQINRDNVSGLKVAWTRALGGIEGGGIWDHGGLEGTPIVEDGFMYVTDGWGSIYKLDVRNGPGKLVWKMDPETDKDWAGAVNCCGVNNRGVALWNDKVISHTLDGRLISTDKETGKIDWQLQLADPSIAEGITGAPLVVKNLAITGVTGAEYGIRGWLAATDLETGQEVWRTYTIPGPGEAGHETWMDDYDAWKTGGGSTWVTGSYDAETDLVYWGVGNPGPDWDVQYRPGDNLYTNSVIAVDPDTCEISVEQVWVAHDCGKALNPLSVEGQIEGSVWMGMGQALTEETRYHEGLGISNSMLDYRVPTIVESPPIETHIVEAADPHGPFGAKEAGETSLANFLPAFASAIADALGVRPYELPLTPDRLMELLEQKETDARISARQGANGGDA